MVNAVANLRGKTINTEAVEDYKDRKEVVYDKLAENLRSILDMDYIYEVLGIKR